jgi:RNA polymerase sigma factor (sigma-70 family)
VQALRDLEPLVRRMAGAAHRHMPASADIEDVRQVARIAAWEADVDFVPGVGSREGFIAQRIQRRIIDWQRTEHPTGRSEGSAVAIVGDDALEDVAAETDLARDIERAQQFDARIKQVPKKHRAVVARILAGEKSRAVAADMGVTEARVSQKIAETIAHLQVVKPRVSKHFDPDAVRFEIGGMPPPKPAKRTKVQMLVDRWPAQGATPVGVQLYAALKKAFAAAGVPYMAVKTSDTTYWVCREPSPEQRKAAKARS